MLIETFPTFLNSPVYFIPHVCFSQTYSLSQICIALYFLNYISKIITSLWVIYLLRSTFVLAILILRPCCMFATESSLRPISSSSRSWAMTVTSSVHLKFSSLFALTETPRLLQSKLPNKSSKVAVNNFDEIVSPCRAPLRIGISLLFLCAALQQLMLYFDFQPEHQCIHYLFLVSQVKSEFLSRLYMYYL